MALNIIEKLSSLSANLPSADAQGRPSRWGLPVVQSSMAKRTRSSELAPFNSIEANLDADVVWSPGPPSICISGPDNFFRHIRVDLTGTRLTLNSTAEFAGVRPKIELRSRRMLEMHVSASAFLSTEWLEGDLIIATSRGAGVVMLAGKASEAHCESIEEGVIDAASLLCNIAAADCSGASVILLRATEALSADIRDSAALLTVGKPKIFETRRV